MHKARNLHCSGSARVAGQQAFKLGAWGKSFCHAVSEVGSRARLQHRPYDVLSAGCQLPKSHVTISAAAGPAREYIRVEQVASFLSYSISDNIKAANSTPALASVVAEWGGSFSYINAAAALSKAAKLPSNKTATARRLQQQLFHLWMQQLPEAQMRQCANVLWALARLGAAPNSVWGPTLDAFLTQVERDLAAEDAPGDIKAQELSSVVWACARLGWQMPDAQLQVLLSAFAQPAVLAAAAPQAISNVVWALSELRTLPGWKAAVDEQLLQDILGEQQLQLVAVQGAPQAVGNVMMGIARLTCGPDPVIREAFASHCLHTLLQHAQVWRMQAWAALDIGNIMWACGQLRVQDTTFLDAASRSANSWMHKASLITLATVAWTYARLRYKDVHMLKGLLQQAGQAVRQGKVQEQLRGAEKAVMQADTGDWLGIISWSVARLDMQDLAAELAELITSSRIKSAGGRLSAKSARQFALVHTWLLQHMLLGGSGLAGLLSEQQLQRCLAAAAASEEQLGT